MEFYFSGTIERIIFENPSNFFRILLLDIEDTDAEDFEDFEIIVTGSMADVMEGEDYSFWGSLVQHPKYGQQLKISRYERAKPSSKGLVKYFSSDHFKGIGVKTAQPLPHQGVVDGQSERCGRDGPFFQERQPQLEASVDLAIMRHVHHGQVFVVLHQRPGRIDHQARHAAEATTLHGPQELQGRTLRWQVLGDRRIRRPRPPGVVVCHPGAGRPPTPDRETQHRSLFPASVPT